MNFLGSFQRFLRSQCKAGFRMNHPTIKMKTYENPRKPKENKGEGGGGGGCKRYG